MDSSEFEQKFDFLPAVFRLLHHVEGGNKDDSQKVATSLLQRLSECRKLLETLPGGHLTANQQSELFEYYQNRLIRKRCVHSTSLSLLTKSSQLLLKYADLPVFTDFPTELPATDAVRPSDP